MLQEKKPKVKILVCCHKPGKWLSDEIYMPIQCGKAISDVDLGIQGDDTGDNISVKNPCYCELTAIYWAWKNMKDVDYIGLCHYRRYFNFKKKCCGVIRQESECVSDNILNDTSLFNINNEILNCDVILPTSRPFIMPIIEAHIKNFGLINFSILEYVILKLYPEYRESLYFVFYHSCNIPQRNMFLMKKSLFDDYSHWLFSILFEVERLIKPSQYIFEQRVYGFMGEMLLPLYCYHNKLTVKKRQLIFMMDCDKESKVRVIFRDLFNRIRFLLNASTQRRLYLDQYKDILYNENILD